MTFTHKYLNQYAYSKTPWLLIRTDKKCKKGESYHTHLFDKSHIRKLKYWLNNNIMPHDEDEAVKEYLIESARKLTTKQEFLKLKPHKKKPTYININKGCRVHG